MNGERIRAVIGEGQPARTGLLRFALENEGCDVVAEANSTMELAQMLVRHRPDLVVLDDGIDAGAIGMVREVLPSAKLILVWPRGVTAVGADARLEPSEVLGGLGLTLQRLLPTRPVITTERPRVPAPDVIVVPDVEEPPATAEPEVAPGVTERLVTAPEAEADVPKPVVPEPVSLEAPRWVFVAENESERSSRANIWAAAIAAAAVILAVIAGIAFLGRTGGTGASRTPSISATSPTAPPTTTPTSTPSPSPGPTTQPGTFEGNVQTHANGTVRFSAHGRARVSVRGTVHIVAHGDVRVRGTGVVRSVSGRTVRVSGSGVVRLVLTGRVRLRLQGVLQAQVVGTTRVGGNGQFLIHRMNAGTE